MSWRHQLDALGEAGYRVVAPDLRGADENNRPEGVEAYHIDLLVADVLAVADDAGADQIDLVGHDWGGAIGWVTAAKHPERIRTWTAVSTPHPAAFAAGIRGDLGGDQPTKSGYVDFFRQPDAPEQFFLNNDASGLRGLFTGLWGEAVDEYVRVLSQPGALTGGLNMYRANSFVGGLPEDAVSVPTMYVWSTDDMALGREAAEASGKYVTGEYRFEVLEGVSHWIPEAAPDDLNRLLLEHLAAH